MARQRRSREEFLSGIGMTCAFAAIWLIFGGRFWVFPLVFLGLLPAVRGAIGLSQARSRRQIDSGERDARDGAGDERRILEIARDQGGRVTPSIVALNSSLSIEKAESMLEGFVKRGYAGLEVNANGRLEYVFSEFLPGPSIDQP